MLVIAVELFIYKPDNNCIVPLPLLSKPSKVLTVLFLFTLA